MSSPRDPSDTPEDLDPTGVRALLSAVPDPGPMPEDLVARISQRLAEEQRRRESGHPVDGRPHAGVLPLAGRRRGRRPARTLAWLAGAAAVTLGTTVALSALGDGVGTSGLTAQYASGGGASESGGAPEGGGDAGAAGGDAQDEDAAAGGAGDHGGVVVVGTPGPRLTAETMTQRLVTWADDPAMLTLAAVADDAPVGLPRARECVTSLAGKTPVTGSFVVATATMDDAEALVVLRTEPGPRTAWVVGAGCGSGGAAEVLDGPVVVD